MSSISAVGSQFTSPLQQLQSELGAEVSAGTIQSGDQSALSTALTDIDNSLQSQRQSDQASGTRSSPADMKSKLQDLISTEVQNGTITSDQATELTNLFAKAMPSHGHGGHGGTGGAGGHGGPGGAGGAGGAGGPGGSASATDTDSDTDSSSSTGSSPSTDTDLQKLLADFLKSVQDSLNQSSATYDGNGQNTSVSAALLINYQS